MNATRMSERRKELLWLGEEVGGRDRGWVDTLKLEGILVDCC